MDYFFLPWSFGIVAIFILVAYSRTRKGKPLTIQIAGVGKVKKDLGIIAAENLSLGQKQINYLYQCEKNGESFYVIYSETIFKPIPLFFNSTIIKLSSTSAKKLVEKLSEK